MVKDTESYLKVRDQSVCYNDKAIAFTNLYDKTPIHETNDVKLEAFIKFGDLLALKQKKQEVEDNELFAITHIFHYMYMLNNGFGSKYDMFKWASVHRMCFFSSLNFANMKHEIIKIGNGDIKRRRTYISLNSWIKIRNCLVDMARYADARAKNNAVVRFKYYSRISGWFWCLDYFFNNIAEYKQNMRFLKIRFEQELKIINTPPKTTDKLYLLQRICRNKAVLHNLILFFRNGLGVLNGVSYLVRVPLLRCKGMGYGRVGYDIGYNDFLVMTKRQIEAMVWVRDNLWFVKPKYWKRDCEINCAVNALKEFLKMPEYYENKYQVEYIEGKTYKSLWL